MAGWVITLIVQLLAFVFVLVASALAIFTLYLLYIRRVKFRHIPGPTPSSFFKGNFPEIEENLNRGSSSFQLLLDSHLQYGDIVLVWLFFLPWVNVANTSDVRDVLIAKNFPKNPRFYEDCLQTLFGQRAMGKSLLTNLDEGEWKHRRSLFNPAFQRFYLRHLMKQFNESSDILLTKLRGVADLGTEARMVDEFSLATLDIICKAGFGIDLNVINDPQGPFIEAYNEILAGVELAFVNPLHKFDVTSYGRQRKAIAGVRFLRQIGRETIAKRRDMIIRGDNPVRRGDDTTRRGNDTIRGDDTIRLGDDTPRRDILDHVLKSVEHYPELTEEDLVDDFVTFFSSGHETTSSTLAFCLLELCHNEGALVRVREELATVMGSRSDVIYDDLVQLKYLGYCLKETLRLYPPAPGMMRITPDDVILCGLSVPKGTTVSASPFVMGRHPRYWDAPLEFLPERWESKADATNFTYFPFSLGPRNCIGQQFAIMQCKVVLAKFLRCFHFALVPGQTKRIRERGSIQPMDGVIGKLHALS